MRDTHLTEGQTVSRGATREALEAQAKRRSYPSEDSEGYPRKRSLRWQEADGELRETAPSGYASTADPEHALIKGGEATWPSRIEMGPRRYSRCLTFELRRDRRYCAWPARRIMNQGASRAKCNAVGPRLERRVRQRREHAANDREIVSRGATRASAWGAGEEGIGVQARTGSAARASARCGGERPCHWWRGNGVGQLGADGLAGACAASERRGHLAEPWCRGTAALHALPNVRVEAGPTVLRLAREAHHVPRRLAGQVQCRWASPRTMG
jgi:hypothetical protein